MDSILPPPPSWPLSLFGAFCGGLLCAYSLAPTLARWRFRYHLWRERADAMRRFRDGEWSTECGKWD